LKLSLIFGYSDLRCVICTSYVISILLYPILTLHQDILGV